MRPRHLPGDMYRQAKPVRQRVVQVLARAPHRFTVAAAARMEASLLIGQAYPQRGSRSEEAAEAFFFGGIGCCLELLISSYLAQIGLESVFVR